MELSTKNIFERNDIPQDTGAYHDNGFEYTKQLYKNIYLKRISDPKYQEKVKTRLEDNYSLYKITADQVIQKMDQYTDIQELISFCKTIKLIDMKGTYKIHNCN